MKNYTNQYFTKKERQSLLLLASMILIVTSIMYVVYHFDKPEMYLMKDLMDKDIVDSIDRASKEVEDKSYHGKAKPNVKMHTQFKKIDPNAITANELMQMGVSKYASSNLEKYRQKGGKIKSKQQFFKIYGMERYRAMLDTLIEIKERDSTIHNNVSYNQKADKNDNQNYNYNTSFDSTRFNKSKIKSSTTIPIVKIKIVELNTADSFELEAIKGVGAYLAARIVKYRNKLGGFYDIDQLEEVYGLRPQTYMDINHLVKANADLIHKIRINIADEKTLASHPYIGRKMASILMRYKKQHGDFQSIDDLMKVKIFDEEEVQRLKWYLDFK